MIPISISNTGLSINSRGEIAARGGSLLHSAGCEELGVGCEEDKEVGVTTYNSMYEYNTLRCTVKNQYSDVSDGKK